MSTLVLGLLIVLAVMTVTFYVAGGLYGAGSSWARDVCSLSRELCDHPVWGAIATGVVAAVYIVLRSLRF